MSFPTVTRSVQGVDVQVVCTKHTETPNHCYKFTATVGETIYEHTLTVGPLDGLIVPVTLAQLQKDVDAARDHAANHAHMRHAVKQLESQIQ